MEGGDPRQAARYFNDWAAGRVTNAELRARLTQLEKFVPYLDKVLGDSTVMPLVNEFVKEFVSAFSADEIDLTCSPKTGPAESIESPLEERGSDEAQAVQ